MAKNFSFADGDRKYQCRVEGPTAGRKDAWWWFEVSGDSHRYAPFHAAAGDTEASVRTRIVTYYLNMLARRLEPATSWHNRGRPSGATAAAPASDGTSS